MGESTPIDACKLVFGGDVMTGRGIDQLLPEPLPPALFEPAVRDARVYVRLAERLHGPIPRPVALAYPWGEALAELGRLAPVLRIVNLETAVTRAAAPYAGKAIHYRMSPAHIGCLGAAQIDACALANNHVLDWGHEGLRETLAVLREAGIATAGAGPDAAAARRPAALPLSAPRTGLTRPAPRGGSSKVAEPHLLDGAPRAGLTRPAPRGGSSKVAEPHLLGSGCGRLLLSAWATPDSGVPDDWEATATRPGVALLRRLDEADLLAVRAAVDAARRPGDRVVVSLHWGANWVGAIPSAQRRFAHRLIDAGVADLVHGHSSHHPLPAEVHAGKLVLYGCGDLLNDYEGIDPQGPQRSDLGCLWAPTIALGDGRLQALELVPFRLRQLRLGTPDPRSRGELRRALDEGGRRFGTWIDETPDGRWRLGWRGRAAAGG